MESIQKAANTKVKDVEVRKARPHLDLELDM